MNAAQITEAVAILLSEVVSAETKAAFLSALAVKGETVEEIAGFARALRDRSLPVLLEKEIRQGMVLDVCGTGGDRLNTFNISTAVALLASAAGLTVAKHGNRAITSQAGSADVLEALGICTELGPVDAGHWLRDYHFAFLFAPFYHPGFRHLASARKLCAERGQRTIFNFLGPLLNPARPTAQLVGVPQPGLCEALATTLRALGIRQGWVISGKTDQGHLDELSALGENTAACFAPGEPPATRILSLADLPLQPATLNDLRGGDRHVNAQIIRSILKGEDRGPRRDAVLLNAGAAFALAQRAEDLAGGWRLAGELIDQGQAAAQLDRLVAASAARIKAAAV